MTLAALVLCALAASPVASRPPLLWAGIAPGPSAVGVDFVGSGEARAVVWYPAAQGGTASTLRDLLGSGAADAFTFLTTNGVSKEDAESYLGSPLLSRRGAPATEGVLRLVLVAPGQDEGPADQAVLAEVLASHGFLVATPADPVATPMKSEADVGAAAERRARQLEAVREAVFGARHAERSGYALVGHSFGARAALLLAMRDARAKALVSLDGGIGSANGVDSFMRAPSFDRAKATLPILHLYEELDAYMKTDLSVLKRLAAGTVTTELVPGLHHHHFTSLGFAAAALPGIARATGAGPRAPAGVKLLAERTRAFLAASLQGPAETSTAR